MFSLQGKNAVVTGGGAVGSMGHGVAECLATQGCNVALVDLGADPFSDDPNKPQPERMAAAVASIEALGVRAVGITADCTVEAEVARAFDEAAATLGSVDISVACVGGGGTVAGRPVSTAGKVYTTIDHETDDYMAIVQITQFATFFTCRAAAQHMRAQGSGGRIIIIGSVMAEFAAKGSTAYSGSKAAIKQMGKVMAHELGSEGITVNTIQPGWMATLGEMRQTDHDGDYTSELGAEPHNVIPSGRMGTPKDIGGAAAFLCSEAASYVNGVTITVDGGFSAALTLPEPTAKL